MRVALYVLSVFVLWLAILSSVAQEPSLDGPKHIFHDDLLENMLGSWHLNGRIAGRQVEHTVDTDWVLNHQFLRIHEKEVVTGGKLPYEAIVMIGYDNASERYVAHWMDIFGGRFSETLGYGKRSKNQIEFVFEYPDGPFHTIFRWDAGLQNWQWLMRQKNEAGQWAQFADATLTRRKE